ncbi:MAG: hypothetical protein Q9187_001872 [Circinaria calcarea]
MLAEEHTGLVAIPLCDDDLAERTIASVGKYLVALSLSWGKKSTGKEAIPSASQKPSARHKQLHVLYLLNDLLHHTKYHNDSTSAYSTLTGSLQSHLVDLFHAASAYDPNTYAKHHTGISSLLDIWEKNGYYQASYIEKLRETVSNASKDYSACSALGPTELRSEDQGRPGGSAAYKNTPFMMPAMHGDPSTPYYDLPAGNMMPHIIPNSATPINTQLVKPLHFIAGPADDHLVTAVKDFMKDVDSLYDGQNAHEDEGICMDINELGQFVVRDETTGEIIGGDGYYGWSKAFCEKMKRRQNGTSETLRGRTGTDSFERSLSPRKRRRYTSSGSEQSRSRHRSRSWSAARPRISSQRRQSRDKPPRFSRSRSRSRSPLRQRPYRSLRSSSHSHSRSNSRSYSPPQRLPLSQSGHVAALPPPMPFQGSQSALTPPQPFTSAFPQGIPLGPRGIPIPPPPPPGYTGPWPPPPPPLPANASFTSTGNLPNAFPTFVPQPVAQIDSAYNSTSPPLSVGSRGYQDQPGMAEGNFGQRIQQQTGGTDGYGYGGPSVYPQNNGQLYGNRGRGGRGGWR